METKVNKTILNYKISHYYFNRKYYWSLGKTVTTGTIFLSENKKIVIEGSNFLLMNSDGVIEGIVLKSNPGYNRIKRLIAKYFSTYRKKGIVGYANSTMREACQQAQYNIRIKQIQQGKISFNHYYSAS